MSKSVSSPSTELLKMVKTLADTKASMPRKQRGILHKEYGVNVEVTKVFDALQYSAGAGRLMPDLRFTLKGRALSVRSYKSGDWEAAVKRAYADLLTQSGALATGSIKEPEPPGSIAQKPRPPGDPKAPKARKKKGLFERLMGLFIESEK